MDVLTLLITYLPAVLSTLVSGLYAYIAYQKSKEPPKDEIWESVTRILSSQDGEVHPSDFMYLYSELKRFKDAGLDMDRYRAIKESMREDR